MEHHLSAQPARLLTSREIAKVLCGFVGTLAGEMASPEDVRAAVVFLGDHIDELLTEIMRRRARAMAEAAAADSSAEPGRN
jgi:hypothetical protein